MNLIEDLNKIKSKKITLDDLNEIGTRFEKISFKFSARDPKKKTFEEKRLVPLIIKKKKRELTDDKTIYPSNFLYKVIL